jgi:hypothetical protein
MPILPREVVALDHHETINQLIINYMRDFRYFMFTAFNGSLDRVAG